MVGSPDRFDYAHYFSPFVEVSIRTNPEGTRDVQFKNHFRDSVHPNVFFRPHPLTGLLRHKDIELELLPDRDVLVARWGWDARPWTLHRFDAPRSRDLWYRWCVRAGDGLAAFQAAFDAQALQPQELFVWGIGAFAGPENRHEWFQRGMGRLGVQLECPALAALWSSGEAERECQIGAKSAAADEACPAESDADCFASRLFGYYGRCSAQAGRCVATAESCAKSVTCRHGGRCTLAAGRCVAGPHDCAGSDACSESGRCAQAPVGDGCVPRSDEDCQRSLRCATEGECHLAGEACGQR